MNKEKLVTVCNNCYTAACLQGLFLCDKNKMAGTVDLPVWILKKLKLENPEYWK